MTDDQQATADQAPGSDDRPTEAIRASGVPAPVLGVPTPVPGAPTPVLMVSGLGRQGNDGWIFRDLDLTLPARSLTAVVGPAGSGRSSLLLALAGRMRPSTGTVSVLGHDLADGGAAVRDLTSVARAADTVRPESALTVREAVDERCLIDDVAVAEGRLRFEQACTMLQFSPERAALVGSVVGERAALLAVALAYVRTSAVILLDDVDRDVRATTRRGLLQALRRLAAIGPAIVVTATDRAAVETADLIIELPPPAGRAEWSFDPNSGTDASKGATR